MSIEKKGEPAVADIKLAGFGGQGILTAGKILVEIAAESGKNICWTSSYGAAMRGGTASCTCVISEEEIGTPYPQFLDILAVMNEPSYEKYKNDVKRGGYIVLNSSLIHTDDYPRDVHIVKVDATNQAIEMQNERGANLIMLGALLKATGLLDIKQFEKGLLQYFERKGRSNPKNLDCFQFGMEQYTIE